MDDDNTTTPASSSTSTAPEATAPPVVAEPASANPPVVAAPVVPPATDPPKVEPAPVVETAASSSDPLDHPDVKAAIAAAAAAAREAALEEEKARIAEEQRKLALTETERLREEATANKTAADEARALVEHANLERDLTVSLASTGRVIPVGDPRLGMASKIVSELRKAEPTLTVAAATAKALDQYPWLGDTLAGPAAPVKVSTGTPVAPAPTHTPVAPATKSAVEMTRAEFRKHCEESGIPVH